MPPKRTTTPDRATTAAAVRGTFAKACGQHLHDTDVQLLPKLEHIEQALRHGYIAPEAALTRTAQLAMATAAKLRRTNATVSAVLVPCAEAIEADLDATRTALGKARRYMKDRHGHRDGTVHTGSDASGWSEPRSWWAWVAVKEAFYNTPGVLHGMAFADALKHGLDKRWMEAHEAEMAAVAIEQAALVSIRDSMAYRGADVLDAALAELQGRADAYVILADVERREQEFGADLRRFMAQVQRLVDDVKLNMGH